jgi:hypothetical protein
MARAVLGWVLAAAVTSASGCANWHMMRPLQNPVVQLGTLQISVLSAEYAASAGRLKVVVDVTNQGQQPQSFEAAWLTVQGGSGAQYLPAVMRPPGYMVVPMAHLRVEYLFRGVSEPDSMQLAIVVGEQARLEFTRGY